MPIKSFIGTVKGVTGTIGIGVKVDRAGGRGRVETDAFDVLVWTLDESGSPWVSTGTVAASLVADSTAPDIVTGVFGNGASSDGSTGVGSKFLTQGAGSHTEAELTSNFTLSAWVYPRRTAPHPPYNNQAIVLKGANQYSSGWNTPYIAIGMYLDLGTLTIYYTRSDGTFATIPTPASLTLNAWSHVGVTLDGTTMRIYRNGVLVMSSPVSTVIYTNHGPWMIGGDNSRVQGLDGIVDDVRFSNTVRNAAWFLDVYTRGTSV